MFNRKKPEPRPSSTEPRTAWWLWLSNIAPPVSPSEPIPQPLAQVTRR